MLAIHKSVLPFKVRKRSEAGIGSASKPSIALSALLCLVLESLRYARSNPLETVICNLGRALKKFQYITSGIKSLTCLMIRTIYRSHGGIVICRFCQEINLAF